MTSIHEKVERNKKIFGQIKQGVSFNQIARELEMSVSNVARIYKTHKAKYLTHSERMKIEKRFMDGE